MEDQPRRAELPKPLIGKPFTEVSAIKNQHSERLMNNPNVVGVGIGIHETEKSRQFAMRVYLKEQPTPEQLDAMEKSIEDVPLLYLTVGEIRAGTETSIAAAILQ